MVNDGFVGHLAHHYYTPGFVFTSTLVALGGAWTTLELLHRRTADRGSRNWYLLAGAALSMGGVALWSMHFVGDRAMILGSGLEHVRLRYRPVYIVGSLFFCVTSAGISLYFSNLVKAFSWLRTVLGGLAMGAAACGMQLLGQASIANYTCINSSGHLAAAVLIAGTASTLVVRLSSHLTSTWTSNWPKRSGCALLIAASVISMHWIAASGVSYKSELPLRSAEIPSETMILFVICFLIGYYLALVAVTYSNHRSRTTANKANDVALALAIFDPRGRLMVSPDGVIPCRGITSDRFEQFVTETFDKDHGAFPWIYGLSHCWKACKTCIPLVRRSTRKTTFIQNTSEVVALRLLFFDAGYELSRFVGTQIDDLGILFPKVFQLANVRSSKRWLGKMKREPLPRLSSLDGVAEPVTNGVVVRRQKFLFLMRRLTESEVTSYGRAGFRFEELPKIISGLSSNMGLEKEDVASTLEQVYSAAGKETHYEAGVHVVCFAVRPGFNSPFDVLARKDMKNLLPNIKLSVSELGPSQLEFLKEIKGNTVGDCLSSLPGRFNFKDMEQARFAAEFLAAVHRLAANIGKRWFHRATLAAEPFVAPCSQAVGQERPEYASIIAFKVIANIHDFTDFNSLYVYVPNQLFMATQYDCQGSSSSVSFAKSFQRELKSLQIPSWGQSHMPLVPKVVSALKRRSNFKSIARRKSSGRVGEEADDDSSQRNLFPLRQHRFPRANSGQHVDEVPWESKTYAERLFVLARQERVEMRPEDSDAWP